MAASSEHRSSPSPAPDSAPAGATPPVTAMPPSAAPANSSGAVQELSRLLLEGWTMLAETCPREGCTMPLARSRDGRVLCCSCGMDVVMASATANANAHDGAVADTERKEETERARGADTTDAPNGVSSAMVPASTGTRTTRMNRDAMSAALGEKLLQGWTLLEQGCERCALPLLRDEGGRTVCVGCQGQGENRPGQSTGTTRQLMPRVLHVGQPRTGNGQGQVARAGSGSRERAVDTATAGGSGSGGGGGRAHAHGHGGRGGVGAGGARVEGGVGITPRLPAPDGDVDDGVIDVDGELWLAEVEAARAMGALRRRLGNVVDAESCRVIGEAMYQLASVVKKTREARDAGAGMAKRRC